MINTKEINELIFGGKYSQCHKCGQPIDWRLVK